MPVYEVQSDGTLTKKAGGIGLQYDSVTQVSETMNVLLNTIYPIGSIRLSINPNEANFLGGTWVIVSQGRALFGAGSSSETPNGETYTSGSTKNAGLPNITGNITVDAQYNLCSANGAFSMSQASGDRNNGSTAQSKPTYSFDASNSNSIYGNSNTVQPNAYICYIYKRTA